VARDYSQEGSADYGHYCDDPENQEVEREGILSKVIGAISILIAAAFFVNTTLAANISLTNSTPVEFGQGILRTTACSGSTALTVKPTSSFTNSVGGGSFYLASIKVSNIPDSCFGSDFQLNAFGETSSAPLALFNSTSTDAIIYDNAGTFQLGSGSTGMTITSGSGEFTISFTVPVALSGNVSRITIQSSPHGAVSCALGGDCIVGDVGPGGGKVFYVAAGGFTCGPLRNATCRYMEIAPTNWNGGTDPQRPWAQSTPVDYTSTVITLTANLGYGAQNTKAIIDQGNSNPTTSAAALAASYSPVVNGNTINDWFLASENEWLQVWNQRTIIGFTASSPLPNYWTSTSPGNQNGRYFMFEGSTGPGQGSGFVKSTSNVYVRPVRAF
jgi:hypothetical protein